MRLATADAAVPDRGDHAGAIRVGIEGSGTGRVAMAIFAAVGSPEASSFKWAIVLGTGGASITLHRVVDVVDVVDCIESSAPD